MAWWPYTAVAGVGALLSAWAATMLWGATIAGISPAWLALAPLLAFGGVPFARRPGTSMHAGAKR